MSFPLESLVTLTILLFALAAWLVQHYASPGTPLLIMALATVSFWLGFGGIALLPIDLSVTTRYEEQNNNNGQDGGNNNNNNNNNSGSSSYEEYQEVNETYIPWLATYWSTFFLAWVVLPLVRETLLSGYFTPITRLRAGCHVALRGYVILLSILLLVIVLLAVRLRSWHVLPVLMAVGNTYGLLLVALLLGYGLVDLPRFMWRQAMPELELRRSRIMAGEADEALFDAVWELQDCEDLIDAAVAKIDYSNRDEPGSPSRTQPDSMEEVYYKSCVDALVRRRNATANLSRELQNRRTSQHRRHVHETDESDSDGVDVSLDSNGRPTLEYLAKLNGRLRRAQAGLVSAEQRWNALVERSQFFSDLASGTVPPPSHPGVPPSAPLLSIANAHLSTVGGRIRYEWITTLRSPTYHLLAVTTAALSSMVLWSEATLAMPINLSPFAFLLGLFDGGEKGVLFQMAALIPLLYMSTCVYSSLFKVSSFGPYCLRGHKQSVGVALVFNAQYLVRLQFPLGYNYLLMLKYDTSSTNCAFSQVMSDMSTVPFFGTSFSVYAPLLILALCGFTLCNGYARLLSVLGIEHEDAILMGDQETLEGKVNEGITLLRRHVERTEARRDSTEDGEGGDESTQQSSSWWYGVV